MSKKEKDDRSMFARYLAPNYPYHSNIATPDDMGMKTDGGLDTLAKDFGGLINYGELLVMGTGNANKKLKFEGKNEPLGDRVFIDTLVNVYLLIWKENILTQKQMKFWKNNLNQQ